MLKYLSAVILCLLFSTLNAQSINYELRMPRPQDHYYHVTMELSDFKEDELFIKMPVWTPGSYLVREFSKNVNLVKAFDGDKELEVKKVNKSTWQVNKKGVKNLTVKYEVYAFEVSVRTSFLDLTHGFVSPSGVFMYVDGHKDQNGTIEIFPFAGFKKITTPLEESSEGVAADGSKKYMFEDYDELVDSPIEIGNQEVFTFMASGVEHTVAMYGSGNYNIERLKVDMPKVINAETAVFGQNPNKKYTFIIHNMVKGQGGLEHKKSTVLSVNRWTYSDSKYVGFLSLVAHEYFHLWNVKRIRPFELGPFNYDEENYTTLLWVMEGFTSYYDELILLRSGFYTKDEYLKKLFSSINYVEGNPGTRVQPVAHSSFDAWVKAYRPNENSRNTTVSYYPKGAVIAAILDVKIIKKYKGKKCLDDFMRILYKKYHEDLNRGFKEDEFKKELEDFLGENLDDFYAKYINGTEIPDYRTIFAEVGLSVNYIGKSEPSVGMSLSGSGGTTTISYVRSGSAAEDAGLSVNDEIVGCNGLRADKDGLEAFFKSVAVGDKIDILFAREQQLYSTEIIVTAYEQPKFSYRVSTDRSTEKLYNYWLRTL